MRYSKVYLQALAYELPSAAVRSAEIEAALLPCYQRLRMAPGQLTALTGIEERRYWPQGYRLAAGCIAAAQRALVSSGFHASAIEALVYAGVCREQFEPATATHVAAGLGLEGRIEIFDVSNACLGMLNGILEVANRIELGQIRAGMVVAAESAREINEETIERLNAVGDAEAFRLSLATLTGGSGAAAIVLTDRSFGEGRPRLLGGATRSAPRYFQLCQWGMEPAHGDLYRQYMKTDATLVLKHGVELGRQTWRDFLDTTGWQPAEVDRVICHQVGGPHRDSILGALGVSPERDFSSFRYLGNTGTVALPITAALAEEQGFLRSGHKVAFLGIGSGLVCQMLGWQW